jgi:hypothetical protein
VPSKGLAFGRLEILKPSSDGVFIALIFFLPGQNLMNPIMLAAAVIAATTPLIVAIITAVWHLSGKLGDIRVSIASLPCRPTQASWPGPRPCRVPDNAITQQ